MTSDTKTTLDEDRLEQLLKAVGERPAPPDELTQEVRSAVHAVWQEEVSKQAATRPTRLTKLSMAAAMGAVGLATWLALAPGTETTQPIIAQVDRQVGGVELSSDGQQWQVFSDTALRPDTYLRTSDGGYVAITLDNGMELRLGENSQVALTEGDLVSLDHGLVYADSHQRPGADITIQTAWGEARDIGTQFQVGANDTGWHVQVREGTVSVLDDTLQRNVIMGRGIRISENNLVAEESVAPAGDSWSWVQKAAPPFSIEGKSVREYLDWVSRETGMKITYDGVSDNMAASTVLHGSIDGIAAEDSLNIVLAGTDLVFEVSDHAVIIRPGQ